MKRVRSPALSFYLAIIIAIAAFPGARAHAGSPGRGGGGFGGSVPYQRVPHSMPHNFEHPVEPRQPVFGPNRSIGGGPSSATPPSAVAPRQATPKLAHPRQSTSIYDFRGKNVRRPDSDLAKAWRRGRWHHGRYHGIYGWWWFVAGYWYWYDEPIFPYPDYVSDEVEPESDEESPPEATPPANPQGDVYYHCSDPEGYYPYVATCAQPWEAVPISPTP